MIIIIISTKAQKCIGIYDTIKIVLAFRLSTQKKKISGEEEKKDEGLNFKL